MSKYLSDFVSGKNPIVEAQVIADGVSSETYLAQNDGLKRGQPEFIMGGSDLAEFAHCPHRWVGGYKDEGTKATEWGTVVDCLLMDGNQERFAICPETYLNDKGEEKPWNFNAAVCKEWRTAQEAEGKQVVKPDVFQSAFLAAETIMKDPQLMEVFKSSRKQVMVKGIYLDRETGLRIPVHCLIDLVPPLPRPYLADFKTCQSAHPGPWAKHVYKFGYHIQAARHLDLWNAATGELRVEFRHEIQESYEPFEIGKRMLSEEFITLGRETYIRNLKRYAQCLATGEWPGYDVATNSSEIVIDGHLLVQPEAWMMGS